VHTKCIAITQNHAALNNILEFANIAWPPVALEQVICLLADGVDLFTSFTRVALDEVVDQQGNVIGSLTEGWHSYGENIQSIEKILAKRAIRDGLFQLAVGRGYHPYVNRDRLDATNALNFPFLEDSEQCYLGFRRQIADLVEENRASISRLKPSQALLECSSEGAFFMPEQFRDNERGWNRCTVHLNEGMAGASRSVVNGASHQFFPRSCFTKDEHCGIRGCDP